MNFYALYSKSQERYCAPFLALDDKDAIAQVSSLVTASQDPALIMSLDDLSLDCVATFNAALPCPIGELTMPVPVLTDLHKALPLPPLVKEKVDALFKKEVNNE